MPKRRANGEGNIRKRKDGRWEGRYTAGHDENGKAITKNVLAKSQAECKEKLKKAIENSQGIDFTVSDKYTVGEWVQLWYDNYIKINLRESTKHQYECFIKNHIKPNIGDIKLNKLTSLDVQKFYNTLKTTGRIKTNHSKKDPGLSNRTVRSIHMFLHESLDKAVKEKLIIINPCDGCKIPPKDKNEMKIIPPDKVKAFLDEAEKIDCLAMFYLELTSGLRRGELLALLWSDLDTENRLLTINKSVGRFDGELKVTQPKTANSNRKILLPKETVDLLTEEHNKHSENQYMFPSPITGFMLDPPAVGRKMKNLLKRAGIEEIRFYNFRYTIATISLKNGVDVKTLSNILGHYSAGFTLDTYTHVTAQMQQDAADKIGEFMRRS